MAKVTRKRTLDPSFTEVNMLELLKTQTMEIDDGGSTAWLALHEASYTGPCKEFCMVSSAEYPKAPFMDQMVDENDKAEKATILDGATVDKNAPLQRSVHLVRTHFDNTTLSAGIQVEKLKCVNFLKALSELVTRDAEGMGQLKYGPAQHLKGGFSSGPLYIVNQPDHKFRELEQSFAVYSMRNEVSAKFSMNCKEFKLLKADILREVDRLGYITSTKPDESAPAVDAPRKTKVSLQRIDLLFNWTRNSHYLMHQDSIAGHGMCYLTVIVNITPYASTLLVAGAKKEVQFDSIGKGVAFPGSFWHRSGETRRGTIKIAFFFKQGNEATPGEKKKRDPAKPVVLSASDDEDPADGAKKA